MAMATIVIVHGMRMPERNREILRATWYGALLRGLRDTTWGRRHPERLPAEKDVSLVYWADLFRPRRLGAPKLLVSRDQLLTAYYAFLRATVRAADALALWDHRGEPFGPIALLVNRLVHESAHYMNNGSVPSPDPGVAEGAYFQIQARFEAALDADTRVVIGHSLGSVVAYEGLCLNPHRVDTFLTVGSPIATPQLILEPMVERLNRRLNRPIDLGPPWPGVRRWTNFYAPADVWSVPVQRLAPVVNPRIVDVEVRHGSPHHFVQTHKLTAYLNHPELRDEIARALEESSGS
jgi:hypothetical protein